MPGTNAGTGHRLRPRCYYCAQSSRPQPKGYVLRVTGRRRYRPSYNGASRRTDVFWQYEVRCEDCGKTGWSRHVEIGRKWTSHVIAGRQGVKTTGGKKR
jgi:hypothetical protein